MSTVRSAMVAMLVPEPLRDEHLDGLAEEFVAMVAEQLLCLGIDQYDAAVGAHDNHGVRRGVQQTAKEFFGTLAVGDVANYRANQQPARTLHGAEADFDRELRAVVAHPV